jgi:hypothetical protein
MKFFLACFCLPGIVVVHSLLFQKNIERKIDLTPYKNATDNLPRWRGRMVEHFKLSSGGGKNLRLYIHPKLKKLLHRSTSPASGGQ